MLYSDASRRDENRRHMQDSSALWCYPLVKECHERDELEMLGARYGILNGFSSLSAM